VLRQKSHQAITITALATRHNQFSFALIERRL
jgi:hypothetical protein